MRIRSLGGTTGPAAVSADSILFLYTKRYRYSVLTVLGVSTAMILLKAMCYMGQGHTINTRNYEDILYSTLEGKPEANIS
jgi:uncharacterized membrane protein YkvI